MKKIFYNLKLANSKLIWCIATLFVMLSVAMQVNCSDGTAKSTIVLPKAENGIEKIEYMVNGAAKGSTDGINSIKLEPGAKITFAVKFEAEGYNKLHVRNVKIKSENGSVLRLNTYAKDDENNFVLMRVQDSELIDPNQTYISSDYIVGKDDKLSFEGIEEDKYTVKISDENNDVNLFDAVKLKYSKNGENYIDAEFSESENAFLLNDLTINDNVKLTFEIREGYTDSALSLINNERDIAIDEKSKVCTLPQLKNDTNLEIRNLEKNSYNITFNEYTNAKFLYKIAGSQDEFKSSETIKVNYGDSLEIKCDASSDDILTAGKITANGKVIASKGDIYTLENIKDNYSIAITPKENAICTISLPENEDRIKLCDTFGNEIPEVSAKQNDSVDFKIIPGDAYKKNFILASMYAVPVSKLSNGNYDINANPEEAKSFLMMPLGNYLYTLKDVNEPVKIIADNMEKNVYTVTLPEKIIGANAEVETNENVTKITENKFKVVHGSDLVVNLSAHEGYDLSTINAADVENSVEIKKDGDKYTFKNIDSDKYLIINGATTSSCKVSFDGNNIIATSEGGTPWKNNTAAVKYQEGILHFKVHSANTDGTSDEDINLNIKSGSGKLEKTSSGKNTYSLSKVTGDIVLSASGTENSEVTVILKSDNDDIKFTDANDENVILPEKNTVKYGTDINFKVLSKSGRSTDNAAVFSTVSNPITASDTSSNTYSLTALRSGVALANTRNSSQKQGHYVDLCNTLYAPQTSSQSPSLYQGTSIQLASWKDSDPAPRAIVFSKDPEACECINNPSILQLERITGAQSSSLEITSKNYSEEGDGEFSDKDYRIALSIPSLNISEQNFALNFKLSTFNQSNLNVNFTSEELSGKLGEENILRRLPNDDSALPASMLEESSEGSYHSSIDLPEYFPSGSTALQYLDNCYCSAFDKLYETVKIKNNLESQHAGITLEPRENIAKDTDNPKDLKVAAYSPSLDSSGYASFDYKPVISTFNVCLKDSERFADGVDAPLKLNDGAHAKLTQKVVQNDSGCYVECTLVTTAFDESVELNFSDNSQIEPRKHTLTLSPVGGIFRNSQDEETNSIMVDYKSGVTFYTEPQAGYQYLDDLTIKEEQAITGFTVDNTSKIKIGDDEAEYSGEWIKLENDSSKIFIRATTGGSKVKYEIAGDGTEISRYIVRDPNATPGPKTVKYTESTESTTASGITSNYSITSTRALRQVTLTFTYTEGIEYTEINEQETPIDTKSETVNYGEARAFKVKAKNGYDISNIQVLASTSGTTNILPLTNGMYVIANITDTTTVSVTGIEKSNISLTFNQYEGIKYKNTSGGEYQSSQKIPYNEEIIFQIDVDEAHSQGSKNIVAYVNGVAFADSPDSENPRPYINDNLYTIPAECVDTDIRITIDEPAINKYTVLLKSSEGVKYCKASNEDPLPERNEGINYGNSFKFRLIAEQGYDMSNIEVVAKNNSGTGASVTLIPTNGIYTIDNITSDYTVTVSGIAKQKHNVEFRTVTGVACLDSYGKTMPSSVTVSDGDDISFYLSFDPAYSKSKDTAAVTIKGTNNKVPKDSSGKYTLSGIKEDKIVEIINVTKNSYTATFVPAEGVVYRTAKGKEFGGTLNVEYGESLYFKISLLDAYDQSTPAVKMNGTKSLLENSGSYVLENISDDVTVTVENVEKNPEEVTIDYIQNVPETVTNEDDVNAVVAATKAYNSLSDDEKKLVTNRPALEKAQNEAANINHNSNGVTISGIDWNVKLIVTPLSDNEEEMNAFSQELERRSLLSLYKAELIDLLTGESYSIPYGNSVQITIPCPDLTGYKNVTVAHRNLADNMEYLDPNIVDGTVKFSATSVGLFGVAAKEIPNYSQNTSDMSISMGELVSNDDELKSLLGEDLSSQLGHLIDLEDENNNNGDSSGKNSANGSGTIEGSDSLLNNMAGGVAGLANSLYNWALDNEFLAVMAVLLLGSLLILLILLANRKKDKDEDENKNLKKKN